MSMSTLFTKKGYPTAPGQNGIGRFVMQLQRVTIKFCKSHGKSKGVREFIEHDLINYAKNNPSVVVYLKPRRHHDPYAVAEYLNGGKHHIKLHYPRDIILKWMDLIRTQSGAPMMQYTKYWHTVHPSIQGPWTPFLFKDPRLNLVDRFPQDELSRPENLNPTATDILLEMFRQQHEETSRSEEEDDDDYIEVQGKSST